MPAMTSSLAARIYSPTFPRASLVGIIGGVEPPSGQCG